MPMGKVKKKQRPPGGDEDDQVTKKIRKTEAKPSRLKKKRKLESKTKNTLAEEKDEISLQLEEERKQALAILNSMLGSSSNDRGEAAAPAPPSAPPEEELSGRMQSPTDSGREKADDQATRESYRVNADLKTLFSSTAQNEKQHEFSFFGGTEEERESSPQTLHSANGDTANPQTVLDRINEDNREPAPVVAPDAPKYFFFHSKNAALRNRLDDDNSFHRTKSMEDLEWEWPERRTAMKEGFRRRRKDAVKLARKKRKYIPPVALPGKTVQD